MAPLHSIVIGAGIGGPVAAILLAMNGHRVTLYDRAEMASGVGYAFRLTPNSDRVLRYLGIDAEAGGAVAADKILKFDINGNQRQETSRENQNQEQVRKAKSVFVFRHQLNAQLLELAVKVGVEVNLGLGVKTVDVEATVVELDNGTKVSADLIIAADGVQSVARAKVIGTTTYLPKASTGHNAFRFMIPKEKVLQDQITNQVFKQDTRICTWMGNNKMVIAYPVDFDKQLNIVCTHPEGLSDQEATNEHDTSDTGYNKTVSRDTVLDIYKEFDPVARRLVEMADANGFRAWKLLDLDEIPAWSKNCTVLVGDACHPVLPYSFSGASMAIEDAITLATLLPGDTALEDIPGRLRLYEETRRARVGRVRQAGRDIARGMQDNGYIGSYMQFLSSHDAVKVAQQALRDYCKKP